MPGGHSCGWWMAMWNQCHVPTGFGGFQRIAWPDGKSLIEQDAMTVSMFDLIEEQVIAEKESRSG